MLVFEVFFITPFLRESENLWGISTPSREYIVTYIRLVEPSATGILKDILN